MLFLCVIDSHNNDLQEDEFILQNWRGTLIPFTVGYLEVCVDLRDHGTAKDCLQQYRNLCQMHSSTSFVASEGQHSEQHWVESGLLRVRWGLQVQVQVQVRG